MEGTQLQQILDGDLPKFISLLKDVSSKSGDVKQHLNQLLNKVKDGELSTSKGISFLETKYHLLLSYLINLTYVLLLKTGGQSIEGDSAINRLIELRTVLEKMRPIEQKLKYQIDKLVKAAQTNTLDDNDPLRFKAKPSNLVSKLDDAESDGGSGEEKESKSKAYVAPRLAAVPYTGDETAEDRQKRLLEKATRRALSSSMLQELRKEYYDGPEEIRESRNLHRMSAVKRAKERSEYEEEHFVRLTVSKKEKMALKQVETVSSLGGLTDFGDISALTGEQQNEDRKRKRKRTSTKGKKGTKKRRRN
ncbi:neuroguidin-like [Gigantopelta aegis]|uniref:neuroguidin-like n=1 Tax=Gigantopelta aegis TaxID=1735272 RepID=UPI001B88B9A5|nr:neuroguidin-like [Gigantopelta aegis]